MEMLFACFSELIEDPLTELLNLSTSMKRVANHSKSGEASLINKRTI